MHSLTVIGTGAGSGVGKELTKLRRTAIGRLQCQARSVQRSG